MLDQKTSEIKAHAKYSASGSSRWMNCAASITLSESAPPQRESDYAVEGTEAHACLEFLLKNKGNLKSATRLASQKYSTEQVNHAIDAVKWVEGRLKDSPDAQLLCETRVDASAYTCEGQFGTLDISLVEEFGRLVVVDYKYGAGIAVDPDENTQLIYYALGLSHLYHHNFTEVELVVIQPRAFHESGNVIRSWVCSMSDLLAWQAKFKAAVEATLDPFATTTAGPWCKFCPAATICPELKDKALKQAQIVFDDDRGVVSLPVPTGIAIPDLGVILDACDKLDAWTTRVREHALHVLERGEPIEGFKLVEKRSIRKWKEETQKKAVKLFGNKCLTEPELLSPAQFEKKLTGTGAVKFLEKYTTSKSSGVTLVRDTDKRPAVKTIESAFSIVDDQTGKELTCDEEIKTPKKSRSKRKRLVGRTVSKK